jgi:hypothetical protein
MNKMNFLRGLPARLFLCASFLAPAIAFGQVPGAGANMINSAFLKLFSPHTNFICRAEIHVLDALQRETDIVPLDLTIADGKMRLDINFADVKGNDLPPAMMPQLKQLGMDESVIIQRPSQKIIFSIYPHAKAYTEKLMSKDEIAAAEKTYTVEKTKVGHETVEGHPCDKFTVILTDEKKVKHTATVWYAADLKDFPVEIRMADENSSLIMKFRDVKLGKASPVRFEAPSGFTKYKTDEALMDAATKGALSK